jgi:hypothetical protein
LIDGAVPPPALSFSPISPLSCILVPFFHLQIKISPSSRASASHEKQRDFVVQDNHDSTKQQQQQQHGVGRSQKRKKQKKKKKEETTTNKPQQTVLTVTRNT